MTSCRADSSFSDAIVSWCSPRGPICKKKSQQVKWCEVSMNLMCACSSKLGVCQREQLHLQSSIVSGLCGDQFPLQRHFLLEHIFKFLPDAILYLHSKLLVLTPGFPWNDIEFSLPCSLFSSTSAEPIRRAPRSTWQLPYWWRCCPGTVPSARTTLPSHSTSPRDRSALYYLGICRTIMHVVVHTEKCLECLLCAKKALRKWKEKALYKSGSKRVGACLKWQLQAAGLTKSDVCLCHNNKLDREIAPLKQSAQATWSEQRPWLWAEHEWSLLLHPGDQINPFRARHGCCPWFYSDLLVAVSGWHSSSHRAITVPEQPATGHLLCLFFRRLCRWHHRAHPGRHMSWSLLEKQKGPLCHEVCGTILAACIGR